MAYTPVFWGVICGLVIPIFLMFHFLIWFILGYNTEHRHRLISELGQLGVQLKLILKNVFSKSNSLADDANTCEQEENIRGVDFEIVDSVQGNMSRSFVFKILFNREKPMSLDILRYFGIIWLLVVSTGKMGYPWTITGIVLFYVTYDVAYFGFGLWLICDYIANSSEESRKQQIAWIMVYSATAGFPIGTVTKIMLGLWMDELWSLEYGLSPYIFLIAVIAFVCEILTCLTLAVLSIIIVLIFARKLECRRDILLILVGSGIALLVLTMLLSAILIAAYGILKNTENFSGFKLPIMREHLLLFVTSWKNAHAPAVVNFLVVWIPAFIFITAIVCITSYGGIFSLYLPDYISSWCHLVSSFMIVYALDNKTEATGWISAGIPLDILLLDILAGGLYYFINGKELGALVDIQSCKREGKVFLLRIKKNSPLFAEIESLMLASWVTPHHPNLGTLTIKDIGLLDNRTKCSYHSWNRYKQGRDQIYHKYQHNTSKIKKNKKYIGSTYTDVSPTGLDLSELHRRLEYHDSVNEYYLFHGTTPDNVANICMNGFKLDCVKRGAFGRALYFAEDSSKSNSYTGYQGTNNSGKKLNLHMFIVRACLGKSFLSHGPNPLQTTPCTNWRCRIRASLALRKRYLDCGHHYDSVIKCPGGTYRREFLMFDDDIVYPEFLVRYEIN